MVKRSMEVGGKLISFEIPRVMGIINFTPDSFYDGGRLKSDKDILNVAERHLAEGASFLDVGCYSSRPGAEDISEEEEIKRLTLVLSILAKAFPSAILSIDTFRSAVAKEGLDNGGHIINDISGGELDPEMFPLIIEKKVPYILMHMKGTPQTMKSLNKYKDLYSDISDYFAAKLNYLSRNGVKDVILDPGFGFAKSPSQSFQLLKELKYLQIFGVPVLTGVSRKSFIYSTLKINADEALNGTTAVNMIALKNGASILRVHDTKEAVEVIELYRRIYF